MTSSDLTERMADAIFGNGRDGLLARVERLELTTSDTNEVVKRVEVAVVSLGISLQSYIAGMPTDRRDELVMRIEKHLVDAAEQKRREERFGHILVFLGSNAGRAAFGVAQVVLTLLVSAYLVSRGIP